MRLNRAMCTQFTAYGARVIEHTMSQRSPNPQFTIEREAEITHVHYQLPSENLAVHANKGGGQRAVNMKSNASGRFLLHIIPI